MSQPKRVFSDYEQDRIEQYRKKGESERYIAWCFGCEVADLPPKKTKQKTEEKAAKKA